MQNHPLKCFSSFSCAWKYTRSICAAMRAAHSSPASRQQGLTAQLETLACWSPRPSEGGTMMMGFRLLFYFLFIQ